MPKNVYIHIPFCKSKCKYCSFISFLDLKDIEAYSLAMGNEIDKYYLYSLESAFSNKLGHVIKLENKVDKSLILLLKNDEISVIIFM